MGFLHEHFLFILLSLGDFFYVEPPVKTELGDVAVAHLGCHFRLLLQLQSVGNVISIIRHIIRYQTARQGSLYSRPGHVEELSGQRTFHIQVQGAGAVQTGRDVHLQQPRLQLRVQEDVEAKEFKAGISAGNIVVVETGQTGLRTQHRLNH